jgi:alkanesulfonate monooxygenase SsuD/methylene tetrahydromethanopterin reductase-like flavin-dependent oxidoreductase (luciferase family)
MNQGGIRVGLYLDMRNPPPWHRPWAEHWARALDHVAEAERRGIDTIWLSEHHLFEDGYLPQPLVLAAAVAARTRRIRIGTAILLVALRTPLHMVEEANVVDLVSGGRLDLGVGAGYAPGEFEAFGVDLGRRFSIVESTLEQMIAIWAHGTATPPPVQAPIPLWGGFYGPKGAHLAGRLGMGLLALDRHLLEPYVAGLDAGGHSVSAARMRGRLRMVLADDPDAAWERIRPHLQWQQETYRTHGAPPGAPSPPPIDVEAWRRPGPRGQPPRFEVLTPDDAARAISERLDGLPVDEVFLWATIAAMPDDIAMRHTELVAGELRSRLSAAPARRG